MDSSCFPGGIQQNVSKGREKINFFHVVQSLSSVLDCFLCKASEPNLKIMMLIMSG